MANNNLKEKEKAKQEIVVETVSSVERFFDENKKIIWSVLGSIIVIGLAVLAVFKFHVNPLKEEASQQMFPAEANFRAGNYDLALNGDGNELGFAGIVKEYGKKAGSSVYMYAGICELRLENFEEAIKYFKKYDGKDKILRARVYAFEGDAHTGLNDLKEALNCYETAAETVDNAFAANYLLKAGIVCEEMGNNEKALKFYETIKDRYPQTMEGMTIDKYIGRIENLN